MSEREIEEIQVAAGNDSPPDDEGKGNEKVTDNEDTNAILHKLISTSAYAF